MSAHPTPTTATRVRLGPLGQGRRTASCLYSPPPPDTRRLGSEKSDFVRGVVCEKLCHFDETGRMQATWQVCEVGNSDQGGLVRKLGKSSTQHKAGLRSEPRKDAGGPGREI